MQYVILLVATITSGHHGRRMPYTGSAISSRRDPKADGSESQGVQNIPSSLIEVALATNRIQLNPHMGGGAVRERPAGILQDIVVGNRVIRSAVLRPQFGGGGGDNDGNGHDFGGTGGDGDGDGHEFLRMLSKAELAIIIEDWTFKSRGNVIGSLPGSTRRDLHNKQMERLNKISNFTEAPFLVFAHFKDAPGLESTELKRDQTEKIRAIAGAQITDRILIRHIAISPRTIYSESDTKSSFTTLLSELSILAGKVGTELDVSPLGGDPAQHRYDTV
jgi:hypothetical protein